MHARIHVPTHMYVSTLPLLSGKSGCFQLKCHTFCIVHNFTLKKINDIVISKQFHCFSHFIYSSEHSKDNCAFEHEDAIREIGAGDAGIKATDAANNTTQSVRRNGRFGNPYSEWTRPTLLQVFKFLWSPNYSNIPDKEVGHATFSAEYKVFAKNKKFI